MLFISVAKSILPPPAPHLIHVSYILLKMTFMYFITNLSDLSLCLRLLLSAATEAELRAKWAQALGPQYQVLVREHTHTHSHTQTYLFAME